MSQNQTFTAEGAAVVTVEQVRVRFGLRSRKAAFALVRKMRHVSQGREVWTTEEYLAEWLAANTLPQMNWPPNGMDIDPLELTAKTLAMQVIGEWTKRGIVILQGERMKGAEKGF